MSFIEVDIHFFVCLFQKKIWNFANQVSWLFQRIYKIYFFRIEIYPIRVSGLDVLWNEKGKHENIWKCYIIIVYKSNFQHYEFKIKLQPRRSTGNTRYSQEYINEILQYSCWKTWQKNWQHNHRERSFIERNGGFEIFNAVWFWYIWRKASWSWRKGIKGLPC